MGTKRSRSAYSSRAVSRSTVYGGGRVPFRGTGERGSYVGRMKRPRYTKPPGKFALSGFRGHREASGQQTGPDVCYLGVASARSQDIGVAVGAALWRKILRRHCHVEVANPLENLVLGPVGAIRDPLPWIVSWYRRARSGLGDEVLTTPYQQTIPSPCTLMDLAKAWSDNVFRSANYSGTPGTAGYPNELYGYTISRLDLNGGIESGRLDSGVIPIIDTKLTVYQLVKVSVQNVTTADGTGENLDADRIDKNPIMGKLFKLGTINPIVRDFQGTSLTAPAENAGDLEFDLNDDGLYLPSGALTGYFAQVPDDHAFRHVKGVARVSMEPGNIKDFTIRFKYSGYINPLIRGFSQNAVETPPSRPFDPHALGFGQCMVLAVEKRMSTGSNNVTLNYQYDTWYGCTWGRTKRTIMRTFQVAGNSLITYTGITAGEPGKDGAID